MKEFTIGQNDAGQRLDKFLTKAVPLLPSSMIYKGIRTKRIKVNGKRAEISTRLAAGDTVSLYLNDEFFEEKRADTAFLRAGNEVSVIYEDKNILIAEKPAGLVVHEDESGTADTLIARVQKYLYQKGEYDPALENSFAPALCNRIDRNTGGIVIAAKNAEALRILNEKIKNREIDKRYLAVIHGAMTPREGTLHGYLFKDAVKNRVYVTQQPQKGAKTCETRYRTLATEGDLSLVECKLITGRTHQIRAQFASAGHPLLGDGKYGRAETKYDRKYQALYSYRLTFTFNTDAGLLQYLNGRSFQVEQVDFAETYFPGLL